MERDFMGLRAKVKQEVPEEITDSAKGQSSTMQWTFSNKGSGPQYLSFDKSSKNEKPKTGFEALASAGLVSITTTESSNILQKQGGSNHAITTFPQKPFDSHSIHHPVDNRKLPVTATSNQTVPLALSYPPTHNSFISSTNPQPVPITPRSVQAKSGNNPVVGTTELRDTSKNLEAPAQLTIFYAGSVCVYDDISPEKAQAIMLLAGNRPTVTSTPQVPTSAVQMPTIRPSIVNSFENQNRIGISCFSNPISATTISSSRSGGGSVSCNDAAAVRTIATLKSPPPSKVEQSKTVKSIGFAPPTLLPPGSDVPLFRKASLARFLVKRKERVLSTSPYSGDTKKSKECNTTPGSSSKSMSVSSSGSCALPTAS